MSYMNDPANWGTENVAALCDDDGIVRHGVHHFGVDYPCTGLAHFGNVPIECANPIHRTIEGYLMDPTSQPDPDGEVVKALLSQTPHATSPPPVPVDGNGQ